MEEKDEKNINTEEDQGADLCPKCGNIMIEEDGKKVCSHCIDNIDFFGEDETLEEFLTKEDDKSK